ncbi:MAG: hypothetical protein HPY60_10190 [Candidatus Methanofastidiosum sp.]|nr:hypothetical protein [Methanofastidiosum sp.]
MDVKLGFRMRRDILYLILLMFIMDIAIFMDIPILRQSLPFIFFSTIPGYLLVKIMNLDLKLLEKSLLSVGLSLAMLIFTGLVINTAYPIIKRPVSLLPMVISLNLLTAILLIVYYLRHLPGGKAVLNIKDAISAPTVFSFLFSGFNGYRFILYEHILGEHGFTRRPPHLLYIMVLTF